MPNQSFVVAWLDPLFVYTLKNEVGAVSGQDALGVRLLPAFDLLDMGGEGLGAAFIRLRIGWPDHYHADRRAVGFELEFVFHRICIGRSAGDAGDMLRGEISDLPAGPARQHDRRYRQPVDLGPVPGSH